MEQLRQAVHAGVDSQMRLHLQQQNSKGWLICSQLTPPPSVALKMSRIVGEIDGEEIVSLDDNQRQQILALTD
jgi:hypothetical protein